MGFFMRATPKSINKMAAKRVLQTKAREARPSSTLEKARVVRGFGDIEVWSDFCFLPTRYFYYDEWKKVLFLASRTEFFKKNRSRFDHNGQNLNS
jgi:hypothetical protein